MVWLALLLSAALAQEDASGDAGSGEAGSGSGDSFGAPLEPPFPMNPPQPPASPPYWAPPPPHVPFESLVSPLLVEYLRAGDRRMVRPSPSGVTILRRDEPTSRSRLDAVIKELVEIRTAQGIVDISLPDLARAKAAEAITLFVTDSPTNRAHIGAAPGVFEALVGLIDRAWRNAMAFDADCAEERTQQAFLAAEASAEALWILAFNSPTNHAAILRTNAIEVLASVVVSRDMRGLQTPPRAAMWAAAALQNLAASYCDGVCPWVWERGEVGRLTVGHSTLTIDAESARRHIAAQPGLIDAVVAYACDGPVPEFDGGQAPWPSKANVESRDRPSIVPWAAAGLLKNLALSDVTAEALLTHKDVAPCLCALARSRDSLERSKSSAALYFLQSRAVGRTDGGFTCQGSSKGEQSPTSTRDEL